MPVTQTVLIESVSGKTSTKIAAFNQDTDAVAVQTVGATEDTNQLGRYRGAFTDLPAGTYRFAHLNSAEDKLYSSGWEKISLTTATFKVRDIPSGHDVNIVSTSIAGTVLSSGVVSGNEITIHRGDDFSLPITGLGDLTGYQNIIFTAKENKEIDPDSKSKIQVDSATGLLVIESDGSPTASNVTITVDDVVAGEITVAGKGIESAKLVPITDGDWDVQWKNAAGKYITPKEGVFKVTADVTRATD